MQTNALISIIAAAFLAACAVMGSGGRTDAAGDEVKVGEIGGLCGGIGGFQCNASAAYCKVEPGVCADTADFAGVCAVKPQMCTMEYAPVCGCDGTTYPNACAAASKGASVAHDGSCEADE